MDGVVPGVPTVEKIDLYAVATSASMLEANCEIRGLRTRSAKSSNCMVSSAEVKLTPMCFWLATVSVVNCSLSSCTCRAAPSVTRARSGRRMRRVEPIFAPSTANESSYWRLTLRVSTRLFSRPCVRSRSLGLNRPFGLLHVTMQSRLSLHPIARGCALPATWLYSLSG